MLEPRAGSSLPPLGYDCLKAGRGLDGRGLAGRNHSGSDFLETQW